MLTINGRFLCKEFPTGTHRSSFYLMSQLCEYLDRYEILCPKTPKMSLPDRLIQNVRVTNDFSCPAHIWEQLFFPRQSNESVHLNLIGTGPFTPASCPMAMVVHDVNYHLCPDSFDWRFRAWYRFVVSRAAKAADLVFAVSEYTKKTLVDYAGVNPDKVFVFQQGPGLPVEDLTNGGGEAEPVRPFILCVGSLQPHKNLAGILEAYDLIRCQHQTACQLVVVGKKQNYFNNAPIDPKHLSDPDIRFTGYISDEELGRLYQQATAFVFPSFEEGFGMPIVEAFYAGCPVITSDCSCMPEIAGDAAVLVNPREPESIADGIAKVTSDTQFRNNLIERGRERAQLYSWKNAAGQVHQELKRLGD